MIIVKRVSGSFGVGGGIIFNDFNDIVDITKHPEFGGGLNITKIDIRSVKIQSGAALDGIQFTYIIKTEGGTSYPHLGNKYGGNGGDPSELILRDDEQIIQISGAVKGNKVNLRNIKFLDIGQSNTTLRRQICRR
jgi:hypothetical protein